VHATLLLLSLCCWCFGASVPVNVYLCVTGRNMNAATANSIFTLLEAMAFIPDVKILPDVRMSSDLVHLRSAVLTEWFDRASDTDIFVFIDNDMVFQPADFVRLIQCDADVCGGIYSSGEGDNPNARFVDTKAFAAGRNNELLYTGGGFTAIKRPILKKVMEDIHKEIGSVRVRGLQNRYYVPFFHQLFTKNPDNEQELVWMGEDYSFCHRVRQAGGVIKGFYSPTLGHEKTKQYFLPSVWDPKIQKKEL